MDDVRQDGRSADISNANPQKLVAAALKRERTRAGLSITELARRAGIGKSTLSQLESGDGNPSVETLWSISVALGIQFSALVDAPRPNVEVIRLGEGPTITAGEADFYTATLLSAARHGTRRDVYLIRADRGRPRVSQPHARGVVEHVVVCVGRAKAGPTESAVVLNPGDYVNYPGDVEHIFDALDDGTIAVLLSES
ncbi:XRE family transcriptional regulator [Gordonia spumicola]|uniref:XRE family transcriptional regulator n=1 Tax=Gordonia spumicola TaxID=589161 RepID=A0A7I9V8R6_9ACTN|nr:helix-turn-helix transcriptional regulator [Gordonia spumicola]GEE01632.1 XRE family transcriptional regulator [Gordonia spumicola]GEE01780.1 XRE family transcriptional regulator [Gordonia spumicola]GEE01788.1 XRE family transcriptional regulator [Gordonia spumicola]